MDYYEILKNEIESGNNRDFFITGDWGIGKSFFIKDFFQNYIKEKQKIEKKSILNFFNKKEFKEENKIRYSIINVSDFNDTNINKEIFYNNQELGKPLRDNILNNISSVEKNNGKNLFTQIFDTTKSILEINEKSKSGSGIVSGALSIVSTVYMDYINNFPLDNFIIVLDEIDRIPSAIKEEDLISKIINSKNKYNNVKFIYIANKIPDNFEKLKEKLYLKELNIKKPFLNLLEYDFITQQTKDMIDHWKLKKNNIRILSSIDDYFKKINFLVENYKINISDKDLNIIKNQVYFSGHVFFSENELTALIEKRDKDSKLKRTEEDIKTYYNNLTEEFQYFINFEDDKIIDFIKKYEKNLKKQKMENDIENFYRSYYILHKNNNNNKALYILNTYFNELTIINESININEYTFIRWILHCYEFYKLKEEEINQINNIIKIKFLTEIDFIKNEKLNFNEIIEYKNSIKNFESIILSKKLYKIKIKIISYYVNEINFLLDNKIKNIKFFEENNPTFTRYLLENDKNKLLKEIIENSNDLFKDLREVYKLVNTEDQENFIKDVKNIINNSNLFPKNINQNKIIDIIFGKK